MQLPKHVQEALKNLGDNAEGSGDKNANIWDLLEDGKYFILPHFFKMMINLKK